MQNGVLLDKLNTDASRNPNLVQQSMLVARSPPSLVLETHTDLPSLPQAPVWQSGAMSTGGRIDVKWAKPMDSGGVDPTGYRVVIKLADGDEGGGDNLIADLQGDTWSCDESGICTGIPGMLLDKISGSVTYSRGGLVINTGYEVQVQLVNEINCRRQVYTSRHSNARVPNASRGGYQRLQWSRGLEARSHLLSSRLWIGEAWSSPVTTSNSAQ